MQLEKIPSSEKYEGPYVRGAHITWNDSKQGTKGSGILTSEKPYEFHGQMMVDVLADSHNEVRVPVAYLYLS